MMMEGRHLKNAPAHAAGAFCHLKYTDLQHYRQSLEYKHAATITSITSFFVSTAIVPTAPPMARLPTSPMNTSAGGALNQRNPRLAPAMVPQKTDNSAASGR